MACVFPVHVACWAAPLPAAPPAAVFQFQPCYYQVLVLRQRPASPPSPTTTTSLSPESRSFQPRRVMVSWRPPLAGWFKLNFDGSVYNDGSGRASVGGAVRDSGGRVVAAFAEPTEHSTVGVVEARALLRGLRLALQLGVRRLVVEGDDLVLVQLLRGEETQTRIPAAMHEEIVALLGRFEGGCEVQHVYREGNQVAHVLCREAYERPGMWKGGGVLPHAVWEKAEEDRRGVAHERLCKTKA